MLSSTASVDLAKAFEKKLRLLLSEAASGIDHLEQYERVILCDGQFPVDRWATSNEYLALLRELNRVSDDVEQYLSDTESISFHH